MNRKMNSRLQLPACVSVDSLRQWADPVIALLRKTPDLLQALRDAVTDRCETFVLTLWYAAEEAIPAAEASAAKARLAARRLARRGEVFLAFAEQDVVRGVSAVRDHWNAYAVPRLQAASDALQVAPTRFALLTEAASRRLAPMAERLLIPCRTAASAVRNKANALLAKAAAFAIPAKARLLAQATDRAETALLTAWYAWDALRDGAKAAFTAADRRLDALLDPAEDALRPYLAKAQRALRTLRTRFSFQRMKRSGVLLTAILSLFSVTVSYAWLSSSWDGAFISSLIGTNKTSTIWYELWTNPSGEDWITESDMSVANPPADKQLNSIGTAGVNADGVETFTLNSLDSLCFGVINNLVQTQENAPVYFKFKFTTDPHTSNDLGVVYNRPEDFAKAYHFNNNIGTLVTVHDNDGNELINGVPALSSFPLLGLNYTVSTENYNPEDNPDEIAALFENAIAYVDGTPFGCAGTIENDTDSVGEAYLYVQMTLSADGIKQALNDTDLKYQMPVYLVFNVELAVEIHGTQLN